MLDTPTSLKQIFSFMWQLFFVASSSSSVMNTDFTSSYIILSGLQNLQPIFDPTESIKHFGSSAESSCLLLVGLCTDNRWRYKVRINNRFWLWRCQWEWSPLLMPKLWTAAAIHTLPLNTLPLDWFSLDTLHLIKRLTERLYKPTLPYAEKRSSYFGLISIKESRSLFWNF